MMCESILITKMEIKLFILNFAEVYLYLDI